MFLPIKSVAHAVGNKFCPGIDWPNALNVSPTFSSKSLSDVIALTGLDTKPIIGEDPTANISNGDEPNCDGFKNSPNGPNTPDASNDFKASNSLVVGSLPFAISFSPRTNEPIVIPAIPNVKA